MLTVESKGTRFYVANQGNPKTQETRALSGIAGYVIETPFSPTELGGQPIGFGSGGNPQCLVEDPSNQFFYTANYNDSTVTGQAYDPQEGILTPLNQSSKAPSSYTLTGPPTYCFVDGRTS
jgi:DNA-binding beta-propeller fold protein YncE